MTEESASPDIKQKKRWIPHFSIRFIIYAVLIWALFSFPTGYDYRAPGKCEDASTMVRVKGVRARNFHGRFFITSVYNEPATLFLWILSHFEKGAELIPKGKSETDAEDELRVKFMEKEMEQSKLNATIAAFRALGYDVRVEKSPLIIWRVATWSQARGILKKGDRVIKIGDRHPENLQQMRDLIKAFRKGSEVPVTVLRGDKEIFVDAPLTVRNGRYVIGVWADTRITRTNLPNLVKISSHNIIGSSAGLIFTLEIMQQISSADLSGGFQIAGTGVIDDNGEVSPVEGVNLKVIAAEKEKAQYFFVPEKNAQEAIDAAKNIKVIPVRNLNDALREIKKLNSSATIEGYTPHLKMEQLHPVK